jgi:hypothetical protein
MQQNNPKINSNLGYKKKKKKLFAHKKKIHYILQ